MYKKPLIFLAICFSISFIAAILFYLSGGKYASVTGMAFASAYMFVPMISVILTQLITKEKVLSGCGIKFKLNWWWLLALGAMPVLVLLSIFVSSLYPGVDLTLESDLMKKTCDAFSKGGLNIGPICAIALTILSGLAAGVTVNALFAFGEEVAWRGFLDRCLNKIGFWKESLLIGAVWGMWHTPLIMMGHNYPNHPIPGVFVMIIFCTLLSPIMMFVREKSKSMVAAAIMHGTLNAVAGLSLIILVGYNDILCGITGLAGITVLGVVDLLLWHLYNPEIVK